MVDSSSKELTPLPNKQSPKRRLLSSLRDRLVPQRAGEGKGKKLKPEKRIEEIKNSIPGLIVVSIGGNGEFNYQIKEGTGTTLYTGVSLSVSNRHGEHAPWVRVSAHTSKNENARYRECDFDVIPVGVDNAKLHVINQPTDQTVALDLIHTTASKVSEMVSLATQLPSYKQSSLDYVLYFHPAYFRNHGTGTAEELVIAAKQYEITHSREDHVRAWGAEGNLHPRERVKLIANIMARPITTTPNTIPGVSDQT